MNNDVQEQCLKLSDSCFMRHRRETLCITNKLLVLLLVLASATTKRGYNGVKLYTKYLMYQTINTMTNRMPMPVKVPPFMDVIINKLPY